MRTHTVLSALVMALCPLAPVSLTAAPGQPVPEQTAQSLEGTVGLTVEQDADGTITRFVSRWLRPLELWDPAVKSYRLYVLEEVSDQRHRFLGEPPAGTLDLTLYPLEVQGAGDVLWQAGFSAQEGAVVDLGLWDPFYEITFGGHAFARESRGLVSLRTGQELVAMTQPVATLYREGEPPGMLLAGLHQHGTVRDDAFFAGPPTEGLLLTLADPERQVDRLLLRLDEASLLATAGIGEIDFGFVRHPGEDPSLRLQLAAGDPLPRLVVRFAPRVGVAIPVGPTGLILEQAVTSGLTLERVGP